MNPHTIIERAHAYSVIERAHKRALPAVSLPVRIGLDVTER